MMVDSIDNDRGWSVTHFVGLLLPCLELYMYSICWTAQRT